MSRTETTRVPTRVRAIVLAGLSLVVLMFIGIGGWGATAPLASAVIAIGKVEVDTNRKAVQHLDGGVVEKIFVRDGDTVAPGDVVLRLDEVRARASLAIAEGAWASVAASAARLLAERDGLDSLPTPVALRDYVNRELVDEIIEGQRRLFAARRAALDGEVSILEQRISQLDDQIAGMSAQHAAYGTQLELIQAELKDLQGLFERGHATRTRVLALQREEARLLGERGEIAANIARTRGEIGETRLQIIQRQKAFSEAVVTELRDVQTQLVDLQERVIASRDNLARLDVRAPVGGTVVELSVHTEGGVIRPGDTIMEIVPADDRLIVQASVRPIDIDQVLVGLPATVIFSAFKPRETPSLRGEVIYVSADILTDERTGQLYYAVRVAVSDDEVARLDGKRLQPGMPAEVMIRTGERTALAYLTQPIRDSINRAWRED
jgi:HlyD family type I secretion membrane fusion protein